MPTLYEVLNKKYKSNESNQFIIISFNEFLELIFYLQENYVMDIGQGDDELCYRGLSSQQYDLRPSIMRVIDENKNIVNLLKYEESMISLFKKMVPEEFLSNESDIDILAKMQHYGLPTRLIDFTTNPLVALYFACCSNYNEDGKIIVTKTKGQLYSEIYKLFYNYEISIDGDIHINSLSIDDLEYLVGSMFLDGFTRDTFYFPKYISQRERNQSAIFYVVTYPIAKLERKNGEKIYHKISREDIDYLLTCIHDRKEISNDYVLNYMTLDYEINECNKIEIIIKHDIKRDIINKLDIMKINNSFLFPELNNVSKAIVDRFLRASSNEEKQWISFKNSLNNLKE